MVWLLCRALLAAVTSLSTSSATAALSHRAGAKQRGTTGAAGRHGAVRPMAFASEVAQVAVGSGGVAIFAGVLGRA